MHRAPVIYRRRFFRRRSRRFSWENRSRSACLLFRANIPQGVSLLRTESGSVARVTGGGRNVVSSVMHEVPPAGVPSAGSDRPFRVRVRGEDVLRDRVRVGANRPGPDAADVRRSGRRDCGGVPFRGATKGLGRYFFVPRNVFFRFFAEIRVRFPVRVRPLHRFDRMSNP